MPGEFLLTFRDSFRLFFTGLNSILDIVFCMSGNEINDLSKTEQHEETEHEHILQALSMFIE